MQSSSTFTFIIAFVVVLALIGLTAYLVRRFGGSRLGTNANRGRMPRLAVIDAAAVDGRRRLVLVRRDNVEHLLMIGGPTDIVVEPNIIRAGPARDQMSPRSSVGGDLPPRATQLPDAAGWTDGESRADAFEPIEEPLPEPVARPPRSTFAEDMRRPSISLSGERTASMMPSPNTPGSIIPSPVVQSPVSPNPIISSPIIPSPIIPSPITQSPMMPSPMIRPEPTIDTPRPSRSDLPIPRLSRNEAPRASRSTERNVPMPPVSASDGNAVPSNAEQNLAEMAQRLEAALRRPSDIGTQPIVTADPPARSSSTAVPRNGLNTTPPPVMPSPKTGYENLEDEMASLLGRPKNPS